MIEPADILGYVQAERMAAQDAMDRYEQIDMTTTAAANRRGRYEALHQVEQEIRHRLAEERVQHGS